MGFGIVMFGRRVVRLTDRLPELSTTNVSASRVRIPPSMDVVLTDRVRRMIDTSVMRRLASVSQLGLVSLVYPGATHSRLEHSLGVYANALTLLRCEMSESLPGVAMEAFLVAALVHDAGHWPFCHPIEDIGDALIDEQTSVPVKHEDRVEAMLRSGPLADCLATDWKCVADDVMSILRPKTLALRPACQLTADTVWFLASCLSGPIDIDKLDYLQRDSLHAGVPYGRNFDVDRIFGSLRRHPDSPQLAIDEKGRTAAEMMVFGRYVMFSEVYWHRTVRAATAMLQRALFELKRDESDWADDDDSRWITSLRESARQSGRESVVELVDGLFGPTRRLFKSAAEFNVEAGDDVHSLLSRRPYRWLVACSKRLSTRINSALGTNVSPTLVLIDAPPVKLEVDINMDVIGRGGRSWTLGQVSPVASVLANRQFDNHVKRVRVFVPEAIRTRLFSYTEDPATTIQSWLIESAGEVVTGGELE